MIKNRLFYQASRRKVMTMLLASMMREMTQALDSKVSEINQFASQNCVYLTESNSGDLMSDSAGKVTLSEWEMLKSKYIN